MHDRYEILTDPSHLPQESSLAEWYKLATEDHVWIKWRNKALLEILAANGMPPDKRFSIMDVGCGNGVVLSCFEKATQWAFDGVDIDSHALSGAAHGRGRMMLYDITERNKDLHEYYDAVFLLDVIEHLQDPTPLLRAALFHLKPGGFLVINSPAMPYFMSRYDTAAGHIRRYDKTSLAAQLRAVQAEILDIRYWGMSLLPLVLLRKILIKRFAGNDEILNRGFAPPRPAAHKILHMVMNLETSLLKRQPVGSSIIIVAKKPMQGPNLEP